jgi:hypothetical protein
MKATYKHTNLIARDWNRLVREGFGHVAGVGLLTFAHATDPEGNIVELQSW